MNSVKQWIAWLMIVMVGCVNQTATSLTPTTTPMRQLAIYNWGTYIAPELLTKFERQYHVVIRYDELDSDDDLLVDLRGGSIYDVIVPSDTLIPLMRTERLLALLNHQNIPNLQNLAPDFVNPAYDPQNRYSVPYQWGTIGIGYHIGRTGRELTSWGDLFDPQFAGRVGLLNDYNLVIGAVLLLMRYSPNSVNMTILDDVEAFLMNHLEQAYIVGDSGQDYLADGRLDVVMEFNGDIAQLMRDDPEIRFIIPEEGGYIFVDSMAIPANSQNKDLAEAFINFILDAQNGATLSNFIRYGSPNLASRPYLNPDDLNDPVIYPPEEIQRRLFYQSFTDAQTDARYVSIWRAFRNANRLIVSE